MNHARTLNRMTKLAYRSGVRFAFKDTSKMMQTLGKLMFFHPRFLTDTVTVLGKTVYMPSLDWSRKNPEKAWKSLAHNLVHVGDVASWSVPLYFASYLFPQCLAVGALGAILAPWHPLALHSLWLLLFLLPWPAPFRAYWELRACALTMAAERWSGHVLDQPPEWMVQDFTGRRFYFMWPFPWLVRWALRRWLQRAKDRKILHALPMSVDVCFSIRADSFLR